MQATVYSQSPLSSTVISDAERTDMTRQSLINYFYEKEASDPDKPYLHQPFGQRWETYSWGEVGAMARRIASYLLKQGLPPNSKIGLVSGNCREWIIADLAIMMAKFVSVPFFPTLSGDQLAEVIELGDVELLFVGKTTVWEDMKTGIPEELKVVRFPNYEGSDRVDVGEDWNLANDNAVGRNTVCRCR